MHVFYSQRTARQQDSDAEVVVNVGNKLSLNQADDIDQRADGNVMPSLSADVSSSYPGMQMSLRNSTIAYDDGR